MRSRTPKKTVCSTTSAGTKRDYEDMFQRAAERGQAMPAQDRAATVDARIQGLAETPRPPGVKKLEGMDNLYRIRCGDYRIVYQIEEARLDSYVVLNARVIAAIFTRLL